VLDDRSKRASPAEWALEAIAAFHAWRADLIVVEDNYGGDMVEHTIAVHDPTVPIGRVHAKRGKYLRAEPVAAMFEPAKARPPMCFLGGSFPELEDQMCLPPWALVAAERGLVPIAELVAGERVWTRRGLAPIEWVGPTGWAYGLREIVHEGGRLWATEDHPILTARGFVPAGDVRSTDRLLVEHRWASTARRWRGEVAGGTGWLPGTTGTPEASFCTVRSTVPITVTSLVAGMSTIATMIPATIGSRTWSRVRPLSTTASILRAGGTRSMIPLRAVACVVPSGNAASRARAPAPSAVTGSPRPGCGPRSARGGAGADRMSVTAMQVYDLKVTDGYSPEFFADGVLVHNCTWVQGEGESPDRLDAMVHALTELLLEPAGEEAPRVVEYEDRVRISPH
jgi:hypothetical protein